jgi:hypothetical protein
MVSFLLLRARPKSAAPPIDQAVFAADRSVIVNAIASARHPRTKGETQQQELDLQIPLRSALTATKGWAAADVAETLARARALADQLERSEHLVPLILGQGSIHHVRAENRLALPVGEQLEQIDEARTMPRRNRWVITRKGLPALRSGSSLPPRPCWRGIWALLIQRTALSGDCPSIPALRRSHTLP